MAAKNSWDSFPADMVTKDPKNGERRRHDDLPRYNATEGHRKSRVPPFHNRNNHGRVSESSKHDTRLDNNNNIGSNHHNNGRLNPGRGGDQFNRQFNVPRKPRTASEGYDGPKSGMSRGNHRQYHNGNAPHRDHMDSKHRNIPTNYKSERDINTEELRTQIKRMKGHMLYLKDQIAYKDQVISHKEKVIIALRGKLDKLKEGSSDNMESSTSPVEPPKPHDIDKLEEDLANTDSKEVDELINQDAEQKENEETLPEQVVEQEVTVKAEDKVETTAETEQHVEIDATEAVAEVEVEKPQLEENVEEKSDERSEEKLDVKKEDGENGKDISEEQPKEESKVDE